MDVNQDLVVVLLPPWGCCCLTVEPGQEDIGGSVGKGPRGLGRHFLLQEPINFLFILANSSWVAVTEPNVSFLPFPNCPATLVPDGLGGTWTKVPNLPDEIIWSQETE